MSGIMSITGAERRRGARRIKVGAPITDIPTAGILSANRDSGCGGQPGYETGQASMWDSSLY